MKHKKIIMPTLMAGYWIAIFTLTHIPIPDVVYKARVSDKTLHFIAYLILTFLLWAAVSLDKINWRKRTIWWVISVLIAYAALDECLQEYIGRSMDIADFFADITGVAAGLILLSFFDFKSCFIIVTGTSIFAISNLAKENLGELMPKTYSMFHLFGYSFFTQLWMWKLHQYRNEMKLTQLKWITIAYALPLGFLAAVIITAKSTERYFELKNMAIAFAAISAIVVANVLALALKNKAVAKADAKNN